MVNGRGYRISGSDSAKNVLMELHRKVILNVVVLGCIANLMVVMHVLSRYHQNISD